MPWQDGIIMEESNGRASSYWSEEQAREQELGRAEGSRNTTSIRNESLNFALESVP